MPKTIKLSKPFLVASGEQKTELELRDLVATDLIRMRKAPFTTTSMADVDRTKAIDPTRMKVELRTETDYDISMDYLSMLTGYDKIVLGRLPGRDFQRCCDAIQAMWNEDVSDGKEGGDNPLAGNNQGGSSASSAT